MRYRRFGRSDLEVSEVGFGVWTLASDWWGVVEDKQGLLHAALDAGINFIDTAPVYGDGGFGEELLADVLKAQRDEIVLTTKCGYDIDAARKYPGQSERPHDWEPASVARAARSVAASTGHRPHRPLPAAQHAHRAHPQRRALGGAREVPRRGQDPRARRRARSRDRLGRRRARSAARPRHRVAADRVQRARAGAGSHVRGRAARAPTVAVGLISRVPHASDTLSGRITRDTEFPPGDHRAHRNRDNMLDNFDKADTLTFLWEGTGRTIGQAAIAGILADPAFTTVLPTCVSVDDVREYAAAQRPPAHRRREGPPRRAVGRQLRRDQPLRDAAEVEHRRVTDASARRARRGSRPTSGAGSCSTSRASSSPSAASTRPSMDDLALAAGVTKPVFYQHFPSKRALFVAVLEDVGGRLLEVLTEATASVETGRAPGRAGLLRLLPLRRERPRRVPPAVRRVGAQRPRVRRRGRPRARRRRRRGQHADRDPRLTRAPPGARARRRRHRRGHQPSRAHRPRRSARTRSARRLGRRARLVRTARRALRATERRPATAARAVAITVGAMRSAPAPS